MRAFRVALAALVMISVACRGAEIDPPAADDTSTIAPTTTQSASSSTSLAPPSTSSTTVTTSTVPVADPLPEPLEIPRLDNGLPATFIAVTEGWEAVEVDTATGTILRSIGVMERPGEAGDEGVVFAAIDRAWRTTDGRWHIVSECCEPAAGMIHYLDPETTLTRENHDETLSSDGWSVSSSPYDGRIARSGYTLWVGEVGEDSELSIWYEELGSSFIDGVTAWARDGAGISWTSADGAGKAMLWRLDLDAPDLGAIGFELPWVTENQWLDGIGTQASGNYVAFLNTVDDGPESSSVAATEGVVFSPTGELMATFPVETGSLWGGYDPSGRVLIYTDGDNVARWQGRGNSGILGEGYVHASW